MSKTITAIYVYPVKSLAGISLQEAVPEVRGLQYDRRWMLVDESGTFVSQREIPKMALLDTAITPEGIAVFPRQNPADRVLIPFEPTPDAPLLEVKVWDDYCEGQVVSADLNQWFSAQLEHALQLVYMPVATQRIADQRYAPAGHTVSYADGFPVLIIGESSLEALNRKLEQPVGMDRFRPNLVFSGGEAFEEDEWQDFSIGNQKFRGVKKCGRCIMTTIDQQTTEKSAEPLKTLAGFRKDGNRILFGQNLVWMGGEGGIRVGDLLV